MLIIVMQYITVEFVLVHSLDLEETSDYYCLSLEKYNKKNNIGLGVHMKIFNRQGVHLTEFFFIPHKF